MTMMSHVSMNKQKHAPKFSRPMGGGYKIVKEELQAIKILDGDENSRLVSSHNRQAITEETTETINAQARHIWLICCMLRADLCL